MARGKKPEHSLDPIVALLQKKFGATSAQRLGEGQEMEAEAQVSEVIPCGVDVIDKYLFELGGYAVPRMTEVYGQEGSCKTALVLQSIASAQKSGAKCALIDAELSFDAVRAKQLGVDIGNLILCTPEHMEMGIEQMKLIMSNHNPTKQPMLIGWDSIASMSTKAGISLEAGARNMGEVPRIMSEELKKLLALAKNHRTHILATNQIRAKLGVMFGCLHYNTCVTLADGGTERIGKIVNQRMQVEVMSFDPATGRCAPAKVVGWHDNGNADYFLQFVVEGVGQTGTCSFAVTPNHMIFVPSGGSWAEKPAGDLVVGDLVGHQALLQFTPLQRQVAIGSVLGDVSLRRRHGRYHTQLRFGHGPKQLAYARWKAALMDGCVSWEGKTGTNGWGFDCRPSLDMNAVYEEAYTATGRTLSSTVLNELTLLGVAIWYLDDGTFGGSYKRWGHGRAEISTKSYTMAERARLALRLDELGCGLPTVTKTGLSWSGERAAALHKAIAPYVPPCMEYKLHPRERGKYVELEDVEQQDTYVMVPVAVRDIYQKAPTRSMRKFDLTVEGHHTYLVSGVGVHNSNTTTPGGYAPKFYSSVRLEFFGGKAIKDTKTGRHTGKVITLVLQKTRFSEPFRKARVRFDYATGWNNEWSTLEHAKTLGLIKGRGKEGNAPKGAKALAEAHRKLGWGSALPGVTDAELKGEAPEGSDTDDESEEE